MMCSFALVAGLFQGDARQDLSEALAGAALVHDSFAGLAVRGRRTRLVSMGAALACARRGAAAWRLFRAGLYGLFSWGGLIWVAFGLLRLGWRLIRFRELRISRGSLGRLTARAARRVSTIGRSRKRSQERWRERGQEHGCENSG